MQSPTDWPGTVALTSWRWARPIGDLDEGVDLLVVGGPTHAWGLSRPNTRRGAVQQDPTRAASLDRGLREWLATPGSTREVTAAAFDTRFHKARWLTGSAARAAAKRLRGLGCPVVAVESFFVTGTPGPLCDGEIERARQWGAALGTQHATTRR